MARASSTLTTGISGGRSGLKAKLVTGGAILGCVAALALGGLRTGEAAGAGPWAQAQPQPVMLAVDVARCVYASAEGIAGEGCGPAQYALIPVRGGIAAGLNCAYASVEGVPGEGCGPAQQDTGSPQP
jgi:hypothetical protein